MFVCVCVCAYVCACVCAWAYVCACVYMYGCVCVQLLVCVHVWVLEIAYRSCLVTECYFKPCQYVAMYDMHTYTLHVCLCVHKQFPNDNSLNIITCMVGMYL